MLCGLIRPNADAYVTWITGCIDGSVDTLERETGTDQLREWEALMNSGHKCHGSYQILRSIIVDALDEQLAPHDPLHSQRKFGSRKDRSDESQPTSDAKRFESHRCRLIAACTFDRDIKSVRRRLVSKRRITLLGNVRMVRAETPRLLSPIRIHVHANDTTRTQVASHGA